MVTTFQITRVHQAYWRTGLNTDEETRQLRIPFCLEWGSELVDREEEEEEFNHESRE